jgi:hypothetical protein
VLTLLYSSLSRTLVGEFIIDKKEFGYYVAVAGKTTPKQLEPNLGVLLRSARPQERTAVQKKDMLFS